MYETMTYEVIMQQMLERVPDTIDQREGSIIYDALAPAAAELAQMYIELDSILSQTFADTAMGENLDKRCRERGVLRKAATNAVVMGMVTPEDVDVLGMRFTCGDYNYKVTNVTENKGCYELVCETSGTEPNGRTGMMIPVEYIPRLQTAKIISMLIPGEEEESDTSLRKRYFDTLESQAFGGNVADYKYKVKSISGVGGVKVTPVWNGGGTVKITILAADASVPTDTLINTVQEIIDPTKDGTGSGLAPIGHVVTIEGVKGKQIDVVFEGVYQTGYSFASVKSYVETAVDQYLKELIHEWQDKDFLIVRKSQIEARILTIEGILDVTNVQLNGSDQNITLSADEIPVRRNVTDGT